MKTTLEDLSACGQDCLGRLQSCRARILNSLDHSFLGNVRVWVRLSVETLSLRACTLRKNLLQKRALPVTTHDANNT